jgi:TrmH family RNA methyltransferase
MLSKTNVKYIQSLRHKKLREEEGCFIAEGPKVVEEFLKERSFDCEMLCGLSKWCTTNELLTATIPHDKIFVIDEVALSKISLLQTPNQVVAVFRNKPEEEVIPGDKITLLLDDIRDPGNMGTMIRIADWFNIQNIVCSLSCVECYNPKVVQSSMGSLARVNIIYTELRKFISEHKKIIVYAASLNGEALSSFSKIKEGLLLIGNESSGIHSDLLDLAHHKITIPKYGKADSLNAAVAAGIILSHLR